MSRRKCSKGRWKGGRRSVFISLPLQVDSVRNITLSQEKAQRAMLIKDCFGDWGVVVGEWSGFRRGVAGTPGVKGVQRGVPGIPGKPGCLMLAFYQLRDKHGVFCANVSTSLFLGFSCGLSDGRNSVVSRTIFWH